MRQYDVIEDFIHECIPRGLPAYRKAELKKELLSHIEDKADFLTSKGRDKEESILETVRDMGDPDKIRQSFGSLYRFERLPAVIAFFILSAVCVFAIFTGFILFSADTTSDYPTVFHYFISASFTGSIIFLYIYGYRRKNACLLLSVTVYMLLNLLTGLLTSGIFQSVAIGIVVIFCALLKIPENVSGVTRIIADANDAVDVLSPFLVGIIMFVLLITGIILTAAVFAASKRKRTPKKLKQKKPLVIHFILIFTLVVTSSVVLLFAARQYSFMDNNIMTGGIVRVIDAKKGADAYEELTEGMTETDVGILLRKYGFREYAKDDGAYYLPDLEPGYSMDGSKVFVIENSEYAARDLYNDTVIIVAFADGKLNYKQVYIYNNRTIALGIWRNEDTARCYESYLTLKEGDSREAVLKKFPSSVAFLEAACFDYDAGAEILSFRSEYENRSDYSVNADLYTELCFVDGKLTYAEITGFGKDKVYDYKELGLTPKR